MMPTYEGPKQVLLIRHGEKLGNPKQHDDGGLDLSILGAARAAALPSLFISATRARPTLGKKPLHPLSCAVARSQPQQAGFHGSYREMEKMTGKAPRFPRPHFIIASHRSPHSNRPVETIIPLAEALGIGYNDTYSNHQYCTVAQELLTQEQYRGKIILVCWHHGKIPAFARKLGIANPPAWPDESFDRVWQITFAGDKRTLKDVPQQLLFGDSSS